jgi:CRP-like cAMP-binding protein
VIRLTGSNHQLLGFVATGEAFEVTEGIEATTQADLTSVIWLYPHELSQWRGFDRDILEFFWFKHQQQLKILNALGQVSALDRLRDYLTLLVQEYGKPSRDGQGACLPFTVTHLQIASAIGVTRVTTTRLFQKLQDQGKVINHNRTIHLPHLKLDD